MEASVGSARPGVKPPHRRRRTVRWSGERRADPGGARGGVLPGARHRTANPGHPALPARHGRWWNRLVTTEPYAVDAAAVAASLGVDPAVGLAAAEAERRAMES